MSYEAELLEKAIKDNDVVIVKQILQVHHGQFTVNLHASILDKVSYDSRSHGQTSHATQDVEILLRKSQTLIDRFDRPEPFPTFGETPVIFQNALHAAVHSHSLDVVRLLLKYGVDPNVPGVPPRERAYSTLSRCSFGSRSPGKEVTFFCDQHTSNFKEELTPFGYSSNSNVNYKPTPSNSLQTECHQADQGSESTFRRTYCIDYLYGLPPLYLAVVAGNTLIVRLLLKYGALADVQDEHGCTPLHLCTSCDFRNPDCTLVLIEHGAKIQMSNKYGVTPCDLYPELANQQKRVLQEALSCTLQLGIVEPISGNSSAEHTQHSHHNFGRFLKRLSSESKHYRHKKSSLGASEDSVNKASRERVSSISSLSRSSPRPRTTSVATSIHESSEAGPIEIEVTISSLNSDKV